MEWGIRRALRQKTPLPLVVYDRGAVGKEPMIRLLGESPAQLEELVDRILKSRAYMREQ
jgi:hydroxymethylpyrimidine/phosphomethylpyrimidine kinase